jgi:glycine/D-amino acid oxidase-like deaminating enzyme
LAERLRVTGAVGALYSPHCARVQPADLVAGLAEAVTRAGVRLYEATAVRSISPGRAGTPAGDVRAPYIVRCTEGFTADLPSQHRTLLPMNSSMIVTGPLSGQAWKSIGWDGFETIGDEAHAYMYAQRTPDGRIALGGRGVPYRFGSGLDHDGAVAPSTVAQLGRILRRMFPAAVGAGIEHAWCGMLGVPTDWCATVTLDPGTGLGWAGGYTGQGVAAANLADRTLADLVRGISSPLTRLPWVGHRSPRWPCWWPPARSPPPSTPARHLVYGQLYGSDHTRRVQLTGLAEDLAAWTDDFYEQTSRARSRPGSPARNSSCSSNELPGAQAGAAAAPGGRVGVPGFQAQRSPDGGRDR